MSGFQRDFRNYATIPLDEAYFGGRRKGKCGQAPAISLIPTTPGAAVATTHVLPKWEGRMDALSIRAPAGDGAITDIVIHLCQECGDEGVNGVLRSGTEGPLNSIGGYNEEE